MAQSVKYLPLGFGSDHDLKVMGLSPTLGSALTTAEPAWNSLSPSPSAPPLFTLSLSPKISKKLKEKERRKSPNDTY